MSHLLRQKAKQIQDKRGKSEKNRADEVRSVSLKERCQRPASSLLDKERYYGLAE
jgi:hypothetical protein